MTYRYLHILLATTLSLWACGCAGEHDHDHEAEGHDHEAETEAEEHHHEPGEIILEPEVAERLGVEMMTVSTTDDFRPAIRTTGVIEATSTAQGVVSAPVAGIVSLSPGIQVGSNVSAGTVVARINPSGVSGGDPNQAAKVAMESARREMERLKPLHDEGIVSTRDYNAAVRAYEEAKAAYSPRASSGTATAPVSGVITGLTVAQGQYVEVGAPIATISSSSSMTLVAQVPQSLYGAMSSINDARVQLPDTSVDFTISEIGGRRTSASTVPAQGAYTPMSFTFNDAMGLGSGAVVDVWLMGSPEKDAIVLPRTAISEQQGAFYVYVRTDEHGYEKRAVTLGNSDGKRVRILSGVNVGDEVVATGVSALRLAETAKTAPEGHSHHH